MVVGANTGPRYFNFASERGYWYDPSQWTVPVRQVLQSNLVDWLHGYPVGNPWKYGPAGWVDAPNAYWIWDRDTRPGTAPPGQVYFRREFVTNADVTLSLFASADENFDAYIDGEKVLSVNDPNGWTAMYRGDKAVTTGNHVLAVVAANTTTTAGFIAALFAVGDPKLNQPATLITYTGDTGWACRGYPSNPPGWTPGEILRTLISEGRDRGVTSFQNLTVDFTDDLDSAGQSWGQVLDWSFEVGTDDLLSVITKMETLAVEVRINPSTFAMEAYNTQGADRSIQDGSTQPIQFLPGLNLDSASEESASDQKTVYLLAYQSNKLVEVVDPTATSNVRIEAYVEANSAFSEFTARTMADKMLELSRDPIDSASISITDMEGNTPWSDFQTGDWVQGPTIHGSAKRRVMSIALALKTATGQPQFEVELDTISQDREDKLAQWLARIPNSGLLGSLVPGAVGATDPGIIPPPDVPPSVPTDPGGVYTGGDPGLPGVPIYPTDPGVPILPPDPTDPSDPWYNPVLDPTSPSYLPPDDQRYPYPVPPVTEPPNPIPKPGPVPPPPSPPTSGGSGGYLVYVQPDEPTDTRVGVLWFDTDASLG